MPQDNLIKLECTKCKRTTHHSQKNKRVIKNRLELSKFCKYCRTHVGHKETK